MTGNLGSAARNYANSRNLAFTWLLLRPPRSRLIEALGEAVREGAATGDLDLVRVATQALAALVGGSGEKPR